MFSKRIDKNDGSTRFFVWANSLMIIFFIIIITMSYATWDILVLTLNMSIALWNYTKLFIKYNPMETMGIIMKFTPQMMKAQLRYHRIRDGIKDVFKKK